MEYVCDAPGGRTWFRLVSEGEAAMESEVMRHAVEKYFRREWAKAAESFRWNGASPEKLAVPTAGFIEFCSNTLNQDLRPKFVSYFDELERKGRCRAI